MDIKLPIKPSPAPTVQASPIRSYSHSMFEVILLVVISLLFYFFLLKPKLAERTALDSKLTTLQQQNDSIKKNKDTLTRTIQELHDHTQQVAELDEALPLSGRVTLYRIAIEKMVSDSGMVVGDVSTQYAAEKDAAGNVAELTKPYGQTRKLQQFATSITVSGSYSQFISLLQKLENSGRIIDVKSMEITSGPADTVQFKLAIQSYFYE